MHKHSTASPLLTRQGRCRSGRKHSPRLLRPLLLASALSACGGGGTEPSWQIGRIAVPEVVVAPLADAERAALADLIGLGTAIADDGLDGLVEPMVERAAADTRLALLPYVLAFQDVGYDESVLRAAYRDLPEWELTVRHVVRLAEAGTPRAARDSARAVAEEVARRARAGEDFATLAARFSEEPGAAERGGLLQPGRKGSWVEPFWNAAAALPPGQVSGVVESIYGYHVIKVDERRAVPFEEADPGPILRWVIRPEQAVSAIEAWAEGPGRVTVDTGAVRTARAVLTGGEGALPDVPLARDAGGGGVTLASLVGAWAALPATSRSRLERSEPDFIEWAATEARNALWAAAAARMGVETGGDEQETARLEWRARAAGWAMAFGFRSEMSDEEIWRTARAAVMSGAAEARAARAELRPLRLRVRELYPVAGPEGRPSSSSETRSSASTR